VTFIFIWGGKEGRSDALDEAETYCVHGIEEEEYPEMDFWWNGEEGDFVFGKGFPCFWWRKMLHCCVFVGVLFARWACHC
jgi:hypothetical protein